MKYMPKLSLSLIAVLLVLPGLSGCDSDNNGGTGGPVPPATQTLTVLVSGGGTVTSLPSGIANCTATGGTCTASFASGSSVQLTATPASGQAFRAWAGACSPSNATPCTVVLDRARQEVAVFEAAGASGLGNVFALTANGRLLSFNRATPGTVNLNKALSVPAGDVPVAIDYRPSDGLLYALTKAADNKGRIYLVEESTANATQIAQIGTDLAGAEFGMDFDPRADVLRIVSDTGQNIAFNLSTGNTGTGTIDTIRTVTAHAFANAFKGTKVSTSYVLDSVTDQLYSATLSGTIAFTLVGNLVDPNPVDLPAVNGFDIDAVTGAAYVAYNLSASSPVIRTINLSTGAVGSAVAINAANEIIRGLALPTPREPQVFAVCQLKANTAQFNSKPCNDGKTLVRFQASTPGAYSVIGELPIGTEKMVAMDMKPSTGELYGLSDAGKIYTIAPVTAAVVQKSTLATTLNFARLYGFDFDPVTENIRIVGGSATGNSADVTHISVNPDTGAVTTLPPPQRAPFKITNIAFTNNNAGASSTVLHGIDSQSDRLFRIDANTSAPPGSGFNPGRITQIANLGFDATDLGGFEIISPGQPPASNLAYATRTDGSNSFLYSLNLTDGVAAQIDTGPIGSLSGFTGAVVGLTAQVNQGASTKFYVASTDAAPNARLLAFSAGNPTGTNAPPLPRTLTNNDFLTGMVAGETVLALEFRFANSANTLFLLARGAGNVARLYTVNTATGAVSVVGATGNIMTQPQPPATPAPYPLEGIQYGMDVEPTNNNIRIVSDANENLVVNATTAVVQVVTDLAQTPIPTINGAAYTRNFAGSLSPTLLLFDTNGLTNDRIMTINDSTGILNSFGPSTLTNAATDEVSFDIVGGHDGLSLATETACPNHDAECLTGGFGFTNLYTINPATGAGTFFNSIGTDNSQSQTPTDDRIQVRAMAIRLVAN